MENVYSSNQLKSLALSCCLLVGYTFSNPVFASEKILNKQYQINTFIGVLDHSENKTFIAIEYEFKFDQNWGAGVVYEDANNTLYGDSVGSAVGSVYFHPGAGWRFGVGAGSEKHHGSQYRTETLYRIGVAYEFNVGGVGIAPSFNVDRIDGETGNIYGVSVVYSF
ncbi:MAG: hypothetical protein HRT38_09035 [Alteromonadaceae bacterium]|nr:hypothetical protein [Alteromonadaceae bacterium]